MAAESVALTLRDLGEGEETPEDIGSDKGPDSGGNQGAKRSLHEIGKDAGDEDEEEWDRCQEESGSGNVRMGDAEDDEEGSD